MKASELSKKQSCDNCHQVLTHTGLPLFWEIDVKRFGIDANALRRDIGLAQFMGSAQLAEIMGPDLDVAKPVQDTITIRLCEPCATDKKVCIAMLVDNEQERMAPSEEDAEDG